MLNFLCVQCYAATFGLFPSVVTYELENLILFAAAAAHLPPPSPPSSLPPPPLPSPFSFSILPSWSQHLSPLPHCPESSSFVHICTYNATNLYLPFAFFPLPLHAPCISVHPPNNHHSVQTISDIIDQERKEEYNRKRRRGKGEWAWQELRVFVTTCVRHLLSTVFTNKEKHTFILFHITRG